MGWTNPEVSERVTAPSGVIPSRLLPVFVGRSLARWKEALLAVGVFAAWLVPFGAGLIRNAPFASGFLGGWRNNDSVYGVLLWATGDVYRAKYAAGAILLGVVAWTVWQGWTPWRAALVITVTILLVASNNHPWYLAWMLVLLPGSPTLGLLAWAALVPLAYRVLPAWEVLGRWEGVDSLRWFIYGPVFLVLLYEWVIQPARRKSKKTQGV